MAVDITAEPLLAYNLTVEGFHTYFVAANEDASPVWVHNACSLNQLTQQIRRGQAPAGIDRIDKARGFEQTRDFIYLDSKYYIELYCTKIVVY